MSRKYKRVFVRHLLRDVRQPIRPCLIETRMNLFLPARENAMGVEGEIRAAIYSYWGLDFCAKIFGGSAKMPDVSCAD